MKDAQNKPPPAGPKHQAQWEIFQISHQRSRYIYDLYYEKEAISKQLYDWLLKNGYADAMLIAKWKKQGYENVSHLTGPRGGRGYVPFADTFCVTTTALLSEMRPDQRDQLQQYLHLPRPQGGHEGGQRDSVRQLRVPRLRV